VLKLTKKADYGLIALKHLAVHGRSRAVSAKELADCYRIPLPLLSKVLQKLSRQGFLSSEQGANGGYRLSRPASQITTLEVVRAIDGPILLTACFTDGVPCDQSNSCIVREPLRKVHEGILHLLEGITIHELSADDAPAAVAASNAISIPVLTA
jgi:Rrf2 family protein